nr:MAG TPA: hypothetical protein [Caudoviricetes sp.]
MSHDTPRLTNHTTLLSFFAHTRARPHNSQDSPTPTTHSTRPHHGHTDRASHATTARPHTPRIGTRRPHTPIRTPTHTPARHHHQRVDTPT